MPGSAFFRRLALAAILAVPAASALADRIDGDWCSPGDARSLSIEGPSITTPGGNRITGVYDRHAFAYVVPEGEADAGAPIAMQQLSEEAMRLSVDGGPSEIWHRCNLNV